MKKLTTILALATLTTAAVGTSFAGGQITARRAVPLTSVQPIEIQLENTPDQAIWPLAAAWAGGVVLGAAVSWAVSEYYHHHSCKTTADWSLNSDAVFDITGAGE